jgi:NAD(P)-dependent dehydrogenase (short-subunit alcohol dehydrogenase family)
VTGVASGIRRATSELRHARSAKVVAEDISTEVEKLGGIATLVADISKDGTAERAVALAPERFGRLDILVNNAGRILYKPVLEMTHEDWEWVMATNVTGPFLHPREAAKTMIPSKRFLTAVVCFSFNSTFIAKLSRRQACRIIFGKSSVLHKMTLSV